MGRTAQSAKSKIITLALVVLIAIAGVGGAAISNRASRAQIQSQSNQTVDVKYKGREGQTALDLLKKYATVQTKHYSFGDQVTSINGTVGNGPKYWSFYLNGKLANVGAGAYKTHDSDNIEWKLQQL